MECLTKRKLKNISLLQQMPMTHYGDQMAAKSFQCITDEDIQAGTPRNYPTEDEIDMVGTCHQDAQ